MSGHDPHLDGFVTEVAGTVLEELDHDPIQPDFAAVAARAKALQAEGEHAPTLPALPALPDPELDGFLTEVTGKLERDDAPAPDFLAVVTRAHNLDAQIVPAAAIDEVGNYAPIISLEQAARLRSTRDDAELDAFVGDVRGHLDHDLARGHADDAAPQEERRRWGFGVAMAAAVLLTLGLGAGLATMMDLRGGSLWSVDDDPPNEAMLSPQPSASQESEAARLRGEPEPEPELELEAELEPELEAELESADTDADGATKKRDRKRGGSLSRRQRLAALEKEANAAWKAGRLGAAEAAFRRIIALDGRGSWGESAYGELFTLQRQRGRSAAGLWKAYLKRFPRGRFADDARAGLCRRAEGDAKAACWTAYLSDMPRGSFRRQARRELDAAASNEDTP